MPSKSANVKNEKQYDALKDKGMSKERAAKIANSPGASSRGGKKSGSGGNGSQAGPRPRRRRLGARVARPRTADDSTWQADQGVPLDEGSHAGALWARRAMVAVLAVAVAAALTGVLGVHTSTAQASRGGYTMSLRYPAVARAGLDVEWQVTVHRPGVSARS
jgi:hypothetical protein